MKLIVMVTLVCGLLGGGQCQTARETELPTTEATDAVPSAKEASPADVKEVDVQVAQLNLEEHEENWNRGANMSVLDHDLSTSQLFFHIKPRCCPHPQPNRCPSTRRTLKVVYPFYGGQQRKCWVYPCHDEELYYVKCNCPDCYTRGGRGRCVTRNRPVWAMLYCFNYGAYRWERPRWYQFTLPRYCYCSRFTG